MPLPTPSDVPVPTQINAPRAFSILILLLWLSLIPQLGSTLLRTSELVAGVPFSKGFKWMVDYSLGLAILLLRGWLSWQIGRRHHWARLSLLWLYIIGALVGGWHLSTLLLVKGEIAFYPYWWTQMAIAYLLVCALFIYLLARKDVVAWCQRDPRTSLPKL